VGYSGGGFHGDLEAEALELTDKARFFSSVSLRRSK
jgi:hypothetical protein